MAATTLDRNTLRKGPIRQIPIPLATGAKIPLGVMVSVATPSAGAVNASDTATHVVMGVSNHPADQTAGDTEIVVDKCIVFMDNDGSLSAANIGQKVFVVDNHTVGTAAGPANDVVAGYLTEVESGGVWVDQTQALIAAA